MITPAGQECAFYYQDFHRKRATQECRLIERNPESEAWQPSLCADCPVPGILRANASPHLALEAKVVRRFFVQRRVAIYAVCSKHLVELRDPHVGCPQCQVETPGAAAIFQGQVADE